MEGFTYFFHQALEVCGIQIAVEFTEYFAYKAFQQSFTYYVTEFLLQILEFFLALFQDDSSKLFRVKLVWLVSSAKSWSCLQRPESRLLCNFFQEFAARINSLASFIAHQAFEEPELFFSF